MNKKKWSLTPAFLLFAVLMCCMSFISIRYNIYLFICELGVSLACLAFVFILNISFRKYVRNLIKSVVKRTTDADELYLENFSFPIVIVGPNDDIVWCNSSFTNAISKGKDSIGYKINPYIGNNKLRSLISKKPVKICINDRYYRIYGNLSQEATMLYYIDDTYYRNIEDEFNNKKASVAFVLFDNADDFDTDSDGETEGEILLAVERTVQKWAAENNALYTKISPTRYMLIFEESTIKKITEEKFKILETIRDIKLEGRSATVSIGIGRGKDNIRESDLAAKKALEMALGRGGDQVAVSINDEYEFYGGVSTGVEKRSKVRIRTFAGNIKNEILKADNVILMGHNYSDLDCVGASIGMYSTITKSLKKNAYIVCNEKTSNAKQLIDSAKMCGLKEAFVSPSDVMKKINNNTLLIILDTHINTFIESKEIYEKCKKIIVIDHHRKMVNFINNALIFFHEPLASSACEMVSEIISYIGDDYLSGFEAGALLSGIMLDTKNFVIKTGVRTFEAAAYLKQKGANTVNVKRLFSGDIDAYRTKSEIVCNARVVDEVAVSIAKDNIKNIRVVAAQAADELLSFEGVNSSFVIFRIDNKTIGISARSYGKLNVQVIMEALGGGGHLTMAACQLEVENQEVAEELLLSKIKELRKKGILK